MKYESTLRWTRITLGVLGASFVFVTFFWSLPQSAVAPPRNVKFRLMCVVPEGWSFFTRDPREPRIQVFAREDEEWRSALIRGSSRENGFGLSRRSRVQGTELAGLVAQIPEDAWVREPDPFLDPSQEAQIPRITVENHNALPTFEGAYLMRRAEPVPWAWSGSYYSVRMPSEYVVIEVREPMPDGSTVQASPEVALGERVATPEAEEDSR